MLLLIFSSILSLCGRGCGVDSCIFFFILTLTFPVTCEPDRRSVLVCNPSMQYRVPRNRWRDYRVPQMTITVRNRRCQQSALQSSRRRRGQHTPDCDLFNNWTLNFLDLTETSEETHSNMASRPG